MSTKSEQLVWNIVKRNNAFLVKTRRFGGLELSLEKNNLTNTNSFKYSGFRDRAVDVKLTKKGARVEKKNVKNAQTPKKSVYGVKINKHGFNGKATSVVVQTQGLNYRPDLAAASLQKLRKLHNAAQKAKKATKTTVAASEVIKA